MEHWLWIILAALCFGKMRNKPTDYKVIQTTGDVTATEGDAVTLNCTFETSSTAYLFWYKQEANGFPKYMLRCFSNTVDKAPEFENDRFDAAIEDKSVPLKIQKLHVSDSAVYYCALRASSLIAVRG
uniref:Ig-like domain-containing protein n=1 Tax=Anabas testudineus TaxID=64144 RepID=A0A3Q1IQD9_ANATE